MQLYHQKLYTAHSYFLSLIACQNSKQGIRFTCCWELQKWVITLLSNWILCRTKQCTLSTQHFITSESCSVLILLSLQVTNMHRNMGVGEQDREGGPGMEEKHKAIHDSLSECRNLEKHKQALCNNCLILQMSAMQMNIITIKQMQQTLYISQSNLKQQKKFTVSVTNTKTLLHEMKSNECCLEFCTLRLYWAIWANGLNLRMNHT